MKGLNVIGLVLAASFLLAPGLDESAEQATKGDAGAVEQQIITIQAQLIQAIVKGDTAFLDKVFADDYTVIHGNGTLSTKAKEIESFRSGATKYDSIEVLEPLHVRVYGDTAVVNELASIRATFDGKPYNGNVRNTRVWVRQKPAWRLVAFQATRAASAAQ